MIMDGSTEDRFEFLSKFSGPPGFRITQPGRDKTTYKTDGTVLLIGQDWWKQTQPTIYTQYMQEDRDYGDSVSYRPALGTGSDHASCRAGSSRTGNGWAYNIWDALLRFPTLRFRA